jgi:RPA family protein
MTRASLFVVVDDDDASDIIIKRERVKTLHPSSRIFFSQKTHAQTAKRGKDERERGKDERERGKDETRAEKTTTRTIAWSGDASAREKDGSERFVGCDRRQRQYLSRFSAVENEMRLDI